MTENLCLASFGSDPCCLPAFHPGPHIASWNSRPVVEVRWSDGDAPYCHTDPRVVTS